MSNKPHHFNDYGFDPHIHHSQVPQNSPFPFLASFFTGHPLVFASKQQQNQVLQQSRKHKTGAIDGPLHFKLQKPFSKDDQSTRKKKHWWRNTLQFFGRRKWATNGKKELHESQAKAPRGSISGPVYMTESSGSSTPYRASSLSNSGPLAGISTPYVCLKELNMEQQQYRASTSSLPIYLVT